MQNISLPEVKGILSMKFIQAEQKGIEIRLSTKDNISFSVNTVDFCRIISILLDNAIEAALEAESPAIEFSASMNNNRAVFTVGNNLAAPAPALNQIFSKGFSTKEGHSGLGLSIVSDLIERNPDIALSTDTREDCFFQEITVQPC